MDVGDAWTKSDICTRIPGLVGPLLRAARLLYGDGMVSSGHRFSMLGVKGGAGIQLVLDRRYWASSLCPAGPGATTPAPRRRTPSSTPSWSVPRRPRARSPTQRRRSRHLRRRPHRSCGSLRAAPLLCHRERRRRRAPGHCSEWVLGFPLECSELLPRGSGRSPEEGRRRGSRGGGSPLCAASPSEGAVEAQVGFVTELLAIVRNGSSAFRWSAANFRRLYLLFSLGMAYVLGHPNQG
jgi:hypothetical protein